MVSLSVQSNIPLAMSFDIYKKSNDLELQTIIFYFGSIYNLNYSDVLGGWYTFNCSSVLAIHLIKGYGFHIQNYESGDGLIVILSFISTNAEFLYKGYIGERFICGIQIIKYNYWPELELN
jgi:hypothetical protein